ncbi:hypothetical protein E4P29_22215 [Rhodococcus sp. 1R11]|uniref:hypothetical protein n=1 Tax=Rhodococcus sp. 1R11 TaxID=2559614 RepID=UPI001072C5BC|nr:hypothetical protein [Rhodococcus sp. 1R11]TFI40909.1 hypothetical protein E4P29_22215 [Rhodococcus sp. 1R11]
MALRSLRVSRTLTVFAAIAGLALTSPGLVFAQEAPVAPAPAPEAEPAPSDTFRFEWQEPSSDPNARAFSWGACEGSFHDPQVVNGFLEWGIENHCVGTGYSPHSMTVFLQESGTRLWSVYETIDTKTTPGIFRGSANISVYYEFPCFDDFNRRFRIKATITAGRNSTQAISDETILPCTSSYDDTND